MINLNVRIERNGEFVFVGRITGTDSSDSRFNYSEEYLKRKDASMISLSLPLQKEPFTPSRTRNFFEGLLPEGFTRHTVAQWLHADEED